MGTSSLPPWVSSSSLERPSVSLCVSEWEWFSLDPVTVVPIVIWFVIYSGNDALFYSICSILRALELSLGILELDPGECRNSLEFLIVKNVFLGVLLGRFSPYPDNERAIN